MSHKDLLTEVELDKRRLARAAERIKRQNDTIQRLTASRDKWRERSNERQAALEIERRRRRYAQDSVDLWKHRYYVAREEAQ